jgi:hypothetical protein
MSTSAATAPINDTVKKDSIMINMALIEHTCSSSKLQRAEKSTQRLNSRGSVAGRGRGEGTRHRTLVQRANIDHLEPNTEGFMQNLTLQIS